MFRERLMLLINLTILGLAVVIGVGIIAVSLVWMLSTVSYIVDHIHWVLILVIVCYFFVITGKIFNWLVIEPYVLGKINKIKGDE